jgi:hypothetical protein
VNSENWEIDKDFTEVLNTNGRFSIRAKPDFSSIWIRRSKDVLIPGSLIILAILCVALWNFSLYWSEVILIAFIYLFYLGYNEREINCRIDIETGKLFYNRGGLFGLPIDYFEFYDSYENIVQVEVKRHIRKYGDAFQIRFLLKNGESLDVTGASLSFSSSQEIAKLLIKTLKMEIDFSAVD